jgi:hypothetical protein
MRHRPAPPERQDSRLSGAIAVLLTAEEAIDVLKRIGIMLVPWSEFF